MSGRPFRKCEVFPITTGRYEHEKKYSLTIAMREFTIQRQPRNRIARQSADGGAGTPLLVQAFATQAPVST